MDFYLFKWAHSFKSYLYLLHSRNSSRDRGAQRRTRLKCPDEFKVGGGGPIGKVILDRNILLRLDKQVSGKVLWKGGWERPFDHLWSRPVWSGGGLLAILECMAGVKVLKSRFMVGLCTIARRWKQVKRLSAGDQISTWATSYAIKYYLLKQKEVPIHATPWMILENTGLGERSKTAKVTASMIPSIGNTQNRSTHRDRKHSSGCQG